MVSYLLSENLGRTLGSGSGNATGKGGGVVLVEVVVRPVVLVLVSG